MSHERALGQAVTMSRGVGEHRWLVIEDNGGIRRAHYGSTQALRFAYGDTTARFPMTTRNRGRR